MTSGRVTRLAILFVMAAVYAALFVRSHGDATGGTHLDPMTPELRAAELAVRDGRLDDALSMVRSVEAQQPADPFVRWLTASILQAQGQWGDEAAAWEAYTVRSSAPEMACPDVAIAHERAGHPDVALQWFRTCVRYSPEHPDRLSDLAAALVRRGDLAEARSLYARALQLDPDNPILARRLAAIEPSPGSR